MTTLTETASHDADVAAPDQSGIAVVSVRTDEVATTIGPRRQDILIFDAALRAARPSARARHDAAKQSH